MIGGLWLVGGLIVTFGSMSMASGGGRDFMRVFAEDLESFFVRHTRFSTLRGDIETFFAASRTLFFGTPDNAAPARLEHLARDLTRAERRR